MALPARKKPQQDEKPQTNQDAEHDPDQAWYWTPEWQEAECAAEEEIKSGQVEKYETGEDFLTTLQDIIDEE